MRAAWATLVAIVAVTAVAIARGLQYGVWANAEPPSKEFRDGALSDYRLIGEAIGKMPK